MKKNIHLGLVLSSFPSYSETFLVNKINGLITNGFKISLFINSPIAQTFSISNSIDIYYKINHRNIIQLLINLIRLFFFRFRVLFRFIINEKKLQRSNFSILKNIIVNCHILLVKKIDWIHFEFASSGINRESLGKAIGAKISCSFRGYDLSFFPHLNPGCYNNLFKSLNKIHTISNHLYDQGLKLGLDPSIKFKR